MLDVSRPLIGVGVGVRHADGIVLLKRKGSHGEGEWSFPGGHLEFGESVLACAKREVKEELGVDLERIRIISGFTEDYFPNKHYITLYCFGYTYQEPKIMEPEKASEICFVRSLSKLPSPLFSGVQEMFNKIYNEI
jgi:8-oxo-dGTP diphosphatase